MQVWSTYRHEIEMERIRRVVPLTLMPTRRPAIRGLCWGFHHTNWSNPGQVDTTR